ncbi:MAG: hypothetical protein AAFV95_21555 [Bacteroidota bacterium]
MKFPLLYLVSVFFVAVGPVHGQAPSQSAEPDFQISLQGTSHVRLDWVLIDEQGNARYEVERSSNGTDYQAVGQIYAYNQMGFQKYIFIDRNPEGNINHYRFTRVDKSENRHLSNSKSIQLSGSTPSVQLVPSPPNHLPDLNLELVQSEKVKIELLDPSQDQRVHLLHEGVVKAGSHQFSLPEEEWQAGNFQLRIEGISFQQNMQWIML